MVSISSYLGAFFPQISAGSTATKRYITPSTAAEQAKISQVLSKPNISSSAPPRIGPTIVPIEPAMLKEAEALSFI
jgi:hypothetical protein